MPASLIVCPQIPIRIIIPNFQLHALSLSHKHFFYFFPRNPLHSNHLLEIGPAAAPGIRTPVVVPSNRGSPLFFMVDYEAGHSCPAFSLPGHRTDLF
jgi:hypothetical protein